MRPGGLIHWLLLCDLVEFGFCLPPMGFDLVQKLGGVPIQCSVKAKGGNGAIQAFEQIQEEKGIQMTYSTSEALGESLDWIVQWLNEKLAVEVNQWMGRSLTVADIEHMLCKISREESRY